MGFICLFLWPFWLINTFFPCGGGARVWFVSGRKNLWTCAVLMGVGVAAESTRDRGEGERGRGLGREAEFWSRSPAWVWGTEVVEGGRCESYSRGRCWLRKRGFSSGFLFFLSLVSFLVHLALSLSLFLYFSLFLLPLSLSPPPPPSIFYCISQTCQCQPGIFQSLGDYILTSCEFCVQELVYKMLVDLLRIPTHVKCLFILFQEFIHLFIYCLLRCTGTKESQRIADVFSLNSAWSIV